MITTIDQFLIFKSLPNRIEWPGQIRGLFHNVHKNRNIYGRIPDMAYLQVKDGAQVMAMNEPDQCSIVTSTG